MAAIADGQVLAEVELEISPSRGQHEAALDAGRPDDLAFHKTSEMLENRIAFFAPAADRSELVVPEDERYGPCTPARRSRSLRGSRSSAKASGFSRDGRVGGYAFRSYRAQLDQIAFCSLEVPTSIAAPGNMSMKRRVSS